jgi:hypothetical protein
MKALWLFLLCLAFIGLILGCIRAAIKFLADIIKTASYTESKDGQE